MSSTSMTNAISTLSVSTTMPRRRALGVAVGAVGITLGVGGSGARAQPAHEGNGVIYAVMDNGDLMWFRHEGRTDGTFRWASNEGRKVGNGWNPKQVFSG